MFLFWQTQFLLLLVNLVKGFTDKSCIFLNLLEEINEADQAIHDVVVLNIHRMLSDANAKDPLLNDMKDQILNCLPKENPVLIPIEYEDFKSTNNSLRLRQASLMFVIYDFSNYVSFSRNFRKILGIILKVFRMSSPVFCMSVSTAILIPRQSSFCSQPDQSVKQTYKFYMSH